MKKSDENRYPHSADLFRFCKEALNIKHNFEVKVIDQHVGAILGYDPADCSHWKKGKKNIKSLPTINTIANHLEVDPRFVTDIISGKMDLEESIQEYKGYGSFAISTKYYDDLKREYFKNPARFAQGGESKSFEQAIDVQRETSRQWATEILNAADVQSCPVFLPEILAAINMGDVKSLNGKVKSVQLSEGETGDKLVTTTQTEDGVYLIQFRRGEMKPHVRFLIARELGRIFFYPTLAEQDNDELVSARINMFACMLMLPGNLLQLVTRQVDHTRDLVSQLSEIFWVSRSVVNARLKDFFTHGN